MAKKQTLKDIQEMYEEKLERVKINANEENILLKKKLLEATKEITNLKKQLKG